MNNLPKIGDIGIYTVNGLKMEVKLVSFCGDGITVIVDGPRCSHFQIMRDSIVWDKQIELVDKPIALDPNIEWHNDLDQESLREGYRPLVSGEERLAGDEYLNKVYWEKISCNGMAYPLTKYRTKRPLSDFLDQKRSKLAAKIKDLESQLEDARQELEKVNGNV